MLSVCDCIRVGSISDVSKSYFLKEFTSLKKEYFINSVQNITQAITNRGVSKENTKNKSDIKNECNTICRKSAEQDQPNKNSFIMRFLKLLKSSFKSSLPVVCMFFI